ncbi:MAG: GntR family transcriptional regulator [Clostridiales bacterium]|nr:GntR family transcriptional regulator [Clostridiales bacterium]
MREAETAGRLYRLYSELRLTIEKGGMRPGDRLSAERELAIRYGVSRMAVKCALGRLVDEGLVYRIHGKGTFVQKTDADRLQLNLSSAGGMAGITDVIRSQGRQCENRVIGAGFLERCDFVLSRLRLEPEEKVFAVGRVRYGNAEPIAVEYSYLPYKYVQGIERQDFSKVSLYDYLDSVGRNVRHGSSLLRVVAAGQREAEHLGIPPGQALYAFAITGLTSGGAVVEYTESYLRADRTELFFRRRGE